MIKVRRLQESDKEMVLDWLERDETHKALGIKWEDFVEPGTEAYIIFNEAKTPLMVVRTHTAERIAMQFNPDVPVSIARHAEEVIHHFSTAAKWKGAKEIIIRPGGKAISFSEKLGFKEFIGKYIKV